MNDFHDHQRGHRGWQPGPRGRARWARLEGFGDPAAAGPELETSHGFSAGRGHPRDHGHGHGHAHWHGGPPPWAGGRRARRGDIRLALLVALLDGPAHGYELMTRLEARSGGAWRPSAGSVYPTLQLLEEEGLTKGRDEDGKRVFELTDEGRSAAEEAAERVGAGPWGEGNRQQMEIRQAIKTFLLAFRQVAAAGDDEQIVAAVGVITDARQRLYRILAGPEAGEAAAPTASPTEEPAD